MREFETGATRDNDEEKWDYEGFLSPLVIERFGEYMHKHRYQADGKVRDSDNWQKGMPLAAYMKSGFRHFVDWWKHHRGLPVKDTLEDVLCAILFNVQGYLHEVLKRKYSGGMVWKENINYRSSVPQNMFLPETQMETKPALTNNPITGHIRFAGVNINPTQPSCDCWMCNG